MPSKESQPNLSIPQDLSNGTSQPHDRLRVKQCEVPYRSTFLEPRCPLANAVVYKWTMVVKAQHAVVTFWTSK
eukprot:3158091-Amphidinium_carterae.3